MTDVAAGGQSSVNAVQPGDSVAEHTEVINLKCLEIVSGHPERGASSPTFDHAVTQIKADGNDKCFICGHTGPDPNESHHFIAEWSEGNNVDFDKLKAIAELFDPYGYSAKMKDI